MAKKIKELLVELAGGLPGFVAAAVVLIDDGLPVAEHLVGGEFEIGDISAYITGVVKANAKGLNLLPGEQTVGDILVTTDSHHFLSRPLEGTSFFVFIMCERDEWLGKARGMLAQYAPMIGQELNKG